MFSKNLIQITLFRNGAQVSRKDEPATAKNSLLVYNYKQEKDDKRQKSKFKHVFSLQERCEERYGLSTSLTSMRASGERFVKCSRIWFL